MITAKQASEDLEIAIRWIEAVQDHHSPGWNSAVNAMRTAVDTIHEQENTISSLTQDLQEMFLIVGEKEKQNAPVKPRIANDDYMRPFCGNCGHRIYYEVGTYNRQTYCGECGRKIDWSRDDEEGRKHK